MSHSVHPLSQLTLAERAALEERLLARHKRLLNRGSGLEHVDVGALTFAQESLWFLHEFAPASPLYNMPLAFRLSGALDEESLGKALAALVQRQAALRTCFAVYDGAPRQQVAERVVELPVLDLSVIPGAKQEKELQRALEAEATTTFDLRRDLPIRALLIRLGDQEHVLTLTLHHIVADFASLRILCRELGEFYNAVVANRVPDLPVLSTSYPAWAARQRAAAEKVGVQESLTYWRERLPSSLSLVELLTDRPRPAERTFRGARHLFHVPEGLVSRLMELARQEGATVYMLLLAALKVLLFRYSGSEDITVGSPMDCRTDPETQDLIGLFLNTLPLRTNLSGDPSFRELLRRVHAVTVGALAHQEIPFERLVEELRLPRQAGVNPLCQVVFQYLPFPWPAPALDGITATPLLSHSGTSKFDLTLTFLHEHDGLAGELEFDTDQFDGTTTAWMVDNLKVLLESIATSPDLSVSRLPVLTSEERARVLVEWNATVAEYPREATVHRLFEEQVHSRPEAVALMAGTESVTYAELNRRANRLAHWLIRNQVTPRSCVGLCLERSIDMVVALLAILKTGAAYVPLDPKLPVERLRALVDQIGVRTVIALSATACVRDLGGRLIALDCDEASMLKQSDADLVSATSAEDPVYVMFTSGSTGLPKPVCVPHRAVVRLVRNTNYVHLGPEETLLQFAPLSFDASTFEIWGALLNGARLVLHPPQFESVEQLMAVVAQCGVTTLWLTAGLFHQVVEQDPAALRGVRQLLAGGDVLSPTHVMRALEALPQCQLINGYGPTENTTFTCCYRFPQHWDGASSAPIGRPINNTQVYILDRRLQPVPIGARGELYAAGDGLALGYLAAPELTAQRFVANPFSSVANARMYRTGDLARYRADGTIEFLGRADDQVKINGFRLHLSEVEEAFQSLAGVRQAAVIALEGGSLGRELAAYVVVAPPDLTAGELRQRAAKALPAYMIPAHIVPVPSLPLTTNGKVDRRALPAVAETSAANSRRATPLAPETPTQETILRLWQDVFGRADFGVDDDFFDLGGHSLLATRVVSRLNAALGVNVSLGTLFDAPTVRALAERVSQAPRDPPAGIIPRRARG